MAPLHEKEIKVGKIRRVLIQNDPKCADLLVVKADNVAGLARLTGWIQV